MEVGEYEHELHHLSHGFPNIHNVQGIPCPRL